MKRDDVYYRALLARDHRFDGKFFVGVKTTGIYCRPICPAKPKRKNVEFFADHLQAERAGYRPCLRCRPESAPRSPAWIGTSAVVRRAIKMIHDPRTLDLDEKEFAARFGVSARHLRRLFVEEIGKTPKQLSAENRLNLARQLITETSMPLSDVAFAAGFGSIRRFNGAFKDRFKKNPAAIRRQSSGAPGLTVSLSYRPPYDFEGLLKFYRSHGIGRLEWFSEGKMHRVVEFEGRAGLIAVSDDPARSRVLVEIDFPGISAIHHIVSRVRAMFDLDSDPVLVANALETDPKTKALLRKHPGIRLPSGWSPFEVAVSAILGQLVSVERGRALVADLIELLGTESGLSRDGAAIKLFPSPAKIAASDLSGLKSTGARKRALIEFSRAVHEGRISLESTQDAGDFLERVLAVPGIGPWTANYMALKALRHTDAFPATDLILARALERHPAAAVERMSPWRGYAAALYWREYSELLSRKMPRPSRIMGCDRKYPVAYSRKS